MLHKVNPTADLRPWVVPLAIRKFSTMSLQRNPQINFLNFLGSTFRVYDISEEKVKIFTKKSKIFCYIILISHFFELTKSLFHAFANNNLYRLYLTDFQCTLSYYQYLFNLSISVTHSMMIRVFLYLLKSDNENDHKKFQWLTFLRINNQRHLVKNHYFLKKEAKRYLDLVKMFLIFTKLNILTYLIGCSGVLGRVLYMAFNKIPLFWLFFSSIPISIHIMIMVNLVFYLYNFFLAIFFANCMFICKSLKSLSTCHSSYSLSQFKQTKLNALAKKNLVQFNYLIKNFKDSEANFNYTFSYCSGMIW